MSDRPESHALTPSASPADAPRPSEAVPPGPVTPGAPSQPGKQRKLRGHVKVSDVLPPLADAPADPPPTKKR